MFNIINNIKESISNFIDNKKTIKIIEDYLESNEVKKLHLGCGIFVLSSWLNSDKKYKKGVASIDITKTFPFDESTFNYIFSEHLIEHMNYLVGLKMLKECFRILKPGGKIRIATPDLKFLIDLYNDKKTKPQEEYLVWATKSLNYVNEYKVPFVINRFFKNWGHQFIYDFNILKESLEKVGFLDVVRYNPGQSNDPHLKDLESHGKAIGEAHNNLETFVVEATKPLKSVLLD